MWTTPYGGGNKTQLLGIDSGIVGSPAVIAFDWLGRNLFLGNRIANNLELVRVDGKIKHRTVILANDGNRTSVASPRSMCLDPYDGKLYWTDDGGTGVPEKVAKVNMDGSNPVVLVDNVDRPDAITIDIEKKTLYFSTQNPPSVVSIDVYGNNRQNVLSQENDIQRPKALAVLNSRLYYLDPLYEKLVRVDLPDGNNPKAILENEPDLKTFTVFRKRQVVDHPCLRSNGGCDQICIPAEDKKRTCACGIGYKKENEIVCVPYQTFAVVTQLDMTRGKFTVKIIHTF